MSSHRRHYFYPAPQRAAKSGKFRAALISWLGAVVIAGVLCLLPGWLP